EFQDSGTGPCTANGYDLCIFVAVGVGIIRVSVLAEVIATGAEAICGRWRFEKTFDGAVACAGTQGISLAAASAADFSLISCGTYFGSHAHTEFYDCGFANNTETPTCQVTF